MTEDYVEEYGLDLYDHVDIASLLLASKGDASVGIFARDDIDEYVPVSDENYVKLMEELLKQVEKKLEEFRK